MAWAIRTSPLSTESCPRLYYDAASNPHSPHPIGALAKGFTMNCQGQPGHDGLASSPLLATGYLAERVHDRLSSIFLNQSHLIIIRHLLLPPPSLLHLRPHSTFTQGSLLSLLSDKREENADITSTITVRRRCHCPLRTPLLRPALPLIHRCRLCLSRRCLLLSLAHIHSKCSV